MKQSETYPISISKSSYQGKQLSEEDKRQVEVTARSCLPSYLFFGHCADESNPYDNMQKREFYSSYATLYQDPMTMESHPEAVCAFLERPDNLPALPLHRHSVVTEGVNRFITTNQASMPAPGLAKDFKHDLIERTFRKSLEQNGRRLHLRDSRK